MTAEILNILNLTEFINHNLKQAQHVKYENHRSIWFVWYTIIFIEFHMNHWLSTRESGVLYLTGKHKENVSCNIAIKPHIDHIFLSFMLIIITLYIV